MISEHEYEDAAADAHPVGECGHEVCLAGGLCGCYSNAPLVTVDGSYVCSAPCLVKFERGE